MKQCKCCLAMVYKLDRYDVCSTCCKQARCVHRNEDENGVYRELKWDQKCDLCGFQIPQGRPRTEYEHRMSFWIDVPSIVETYGFQYYNGLQWPAPIRPINQADGAHS